MVTTPSASSTKIDWYAVLAISPFLAERFRRNLGDMTIRGALVTVVVALGMVVVAPSVSAVAAPAPVSTASAAFWQLHDAANTNISLQANDDAAHTPPAGLAKSSTVFL